MTDVNRCWTILSNIVQYCLIFWNICFIFKYHQLFFNFVKCSHLLSNAASWPTTIHEYFFDFFRYCPSPISCFKGISCLFHWNFMNSSGLFWNINQSYLFQNILNIFQECLPMDLTQCRNILHHYRIDRYDKISTL